jgi:hypothetical protein
MNVNQPHIDFAPVNNMYMPPKPSKDVSRDSLSILALLAIIIAITSSVVYTTTSRGAQLSEQTQLLPNAQLNNSIQAIVNGSTIIFQVRTNGTAFTQRENVEIEIVIINNSTEAIIFSTPPEEFTLRIVDSSGDEKLVRSAYIGNIPAPITIKPFSELLVEHYIWNQTEPVISKGETILEQVPPGQYFIEAMIREPPSPSMPLAGNVTTVIMVR